MTGHPARWEHRRGGGRPSRVGDDPDLTVQIAIGIEHFEEGLENSIMGNYYAEGKDKAAAKLRHGQSIAAAIGTAHSKNLHGQPEDDPARHHGREVSLG